MSNESDHAYKYIRDEIVAGALKPGDQLSEARLSEACGVSRTPVREALRRLELEQLIRRTETQRAFVADWSFDEVEEGFVLRAMLEGRAAVRAATRVNAPTLARLEFHNRAIEETARAKTLKIADFVENNRAFHMLVLEAAASQRLSSSLLGIVEQPILLRTARQYDRAQVLQSFADHEELLRSFRKQDPEWANIIMSAHIRRAFHAYRDAYHASQGRSTDTRTPRIARAGSVKRSSTRPSARRDDLVLKGDSVSRHKTVNTIQAIPSKAKKPFDGNRL